MEQRPETLRFAGALSGFGMVLLGFMSALMAVLALGLLALVVLQDAGLSVLAGALVCALLAFFLFIPVRRDWRRFRTLVIDEDGTWHLYNPLGQPLHTLEPSDKRAIDAMGRDAWMLIGTWRRARLSWLRIELPDGRVFRSTTSTLTYQEPALRALDAHVNEARPSEEEP